MAQWSRQTLLATTALVILLSLATSAQADGYVGDMPISSVYENSGATVWDSPQNHSQISNPAGASILNLSAARGDVIDNGGVIRNAPGATWTGDVAVGANKPGAKIVNEGDWHNLLPSSSLHNAGGGIDNSGNIGTVENDSGVFSNEGVAARLDNHGQADNNGLINAPSSNFGVFVNNAAGVVASGLTDSGRTTNSGLIKGGVLESGAFVNNASGRVLDGFALSGGSAVNDGEIDGGVQQSAGSFTDNGVVKGGAKIAGAEAAFTVNGVLAGAATVSAGSLVVNSAGAIQGDIDNAGALTNAGAIHGDVRNAGVFVNNGGVDGGLRQTAGQTTNNGALQGDVAILGGAAVNNGAIAGAAQIGAGAAMIDNGAIGGVVRNFGSYTENASGAVKGRFVNAGEATVNGLLAGGALDNGKLTINASGRVENGLTTDGGATVNAGAIKGGATVRSGVLTTSGVIEGGLTDAGLVKATGTISGPIYVTGQLLVGDGTATGERLTLAPGSTVNGVITLPVDLSTGKANFLSARGASLDGAQLGLTGRLANSNGAYWGRLSLTDAPIALTPEAKAALAAASGPLYAYSLRSGTELTQTINPGLGATAGQIALAATTAFTLALSPAPLAPERGGVSAWARGIGAGLTVSGENNAGTGPAFDATRLATRLGGAELGLDYTFGPASGLKLSLGLAGGEVAGSVADRAGSGASGRVSLPYIGGYAALTGLGFVGRFDARYLSLDMRLTDAPLAVYDQAQRASGVSLGLQASYRLPLGDFYVQPEGGLSYARLAIANEATNVGALSFGRAQLGLAHAGLRLGTEYADAVSVWRPYVLGGVWGAWRSGAPIYVPQGPTITPTGLAGFGQVGLGLEAIFTSGLSGFVQGEGVLGGRVAGLAATGGLKFSF